jgi:hypothetical protein
MKRLPKTLRPIFIWYIYANVKLHNNNHRSVASSYLKFTETASSSSYSFNHIFINFIFQLLTALASFYANKKTS